MREPPNRRIPYEAFEPRVVLSAQGWDALAGPPPLVSPAGDQELLGDAVPSNPADQLRADLEYIRQRYGLQGQGQTVAIVDSGVAYDHVALGSGFGPPHRVVGGWDFTEENDGDPFDDPPAGFHGTHVAGVIASGDQQHPGVAPQVDLVALRVLNDHGIGRLEWVEQSLRWIHNNREAFEHPITAVNLSVGASLNGDAASRDILEDELAQLEADGMFIAVAAGNSFQRDAGTNLTYPASSSHVVPVASLDADGRLSTFSQRDSRILAVPGEDVTSTVPRHVFGGGAIANDFAHAHGTSMASPYVAGASVLVREAMQLAGHESIDQDRIEAHLRQTADRVDDPTSDQTYLRMNVRRAIDALLADGDAGNDSWDDPVLVDGRTMRVSGTSDVNTIQVDLGTPLRVAVNGDVYEFEPANLDRLLVQGSGSFSTAVIHATEDDETVTGSPDELRMSGGAVELVVRNVQQVEVHAGGGTDVAHLSDSVGGDRFYAHADRSVLSGFGYRQEVVGFARVFAYAAAGGHDEAHFYDSSHNDRFYARPDHWTMSGWGYQTRGSGFDRVQAQATLGGDDQAILYDTAGDDRFHSRVTEASLGNAARQTRVRGFDRVTAHAVSGGQDHAYFHDSPSADRFEAHPTQAAMSGLGYHHRARGFDLYHAESAGSLDSAELYGSFADDHLTSGADAVALQGPGYAMSVERFDVVRAAGGGGNDWATLSDVQADDLTYGLEDAAWSHNGRGSRSISDFAEIMLATGRGDADLVALQHVFREAGRQR